jgi:hypothetical protein
MKGIRKRRWWGLYVVILCTMLALLAVDRASGHGEVWHEVLSLAIVMIACGLAWLWIERNAERVGSQGVDAQAKAQVLAGQGIKPGRLAPSISARQAHYRHVMLVAPYYPPDTEYPERLPGK